MSDPVVSIVMGSDSDLKVMKAAAEALDELGLPYELTVLSAHRTPRRAMNFAERAAGEYLKGLWSYGQEYNSPRLLLKHGGGRLDAGPLLHLLTQTLGR